MQCNLKLHLRGWALTKRETMNEIPAQLAMKNASYKRLEIANLHFLVYIYISICRIPECLVRLYSYRSSESVQSFAKILQNFLKNIAFKFY